MVCRVHLLSQLYLFAAMVVRALPLKLRLDWESPVRGLLPDRFRHPIRDDMYIALLSIDQPRRFHAFATIPLATK
jgi:hypothetical protein